MPQSMSHIANRSPASMMQGSLQSDDVPDDLECLASGFWIIDNSRVSCGEFCSSAAGFWHRNCFSPTVQSSLVPPRSFLNWQSQSQLTSSEGENWIVRFCRSDHPRIYIGCSKSLWSTQKGRSQRICSGRRPCGPFAIANHERDRFRDTLFSAVAWWMVLSK